MSRRAIGVRAMLRLAALIVISAPVAPGAGPAGAATAATAPAPLTRGHRLAVISIDGLGPADYLDNERCGGRLRAIARLMREGTWSEGVEGVLPTLTYPSHATLVTGVPPSVHGVLANARPDGAPWHLDRADMHAPTLWDAAREAGLTVAIVTWPSTYGADVPYLIPENLAQGKGTDVAGLIRAGSTPGLFESLEAETRPVHLLPFEDPQAGRPLDRMTAAFAAALVRRARPDLLLLHFLDFDHFEHQFGPGQRQACRSLERIDRLVGSIRAAYDAAGLGDETAFVIVSDHGFLPVHTVIDASAVVAALSGSFTIRLGGGSLALYRAGNGGGNGSKRGSISDSRWEADARERLRARFGDILRVLPAEAASSMGGFPEAALVLCARPGYYFVDHVEGPGPLAPAPTRGYHGFCPDEREMDAAFIAAGPGVPAAGRSPRLRLTAVAARLAGILGLDFPPPR